MNWTRGRLQRHSSNNKTAALTKIQKQNFAKARVKSSKDKYHQLPFQNFPQFGHFSNEIIPQDQEANNVDVVAIHTSTQQSGPAPTNQQNSSLPNTRDPSQKVTRLDIIKRQLLDKPDWAVVSASRPLQITFTPIEELERFGKRRRLTENDRKRLANDVGMLQAPELVIGRARRQENTPSQIADDDIDIRINGVRPGEAPARRYWNITSDYTSSQPMLLGRDSISPEYHPRTQKPYIRDDREPESELSLLLSTSVQPASTPGELPALNNATQDNTQILPDNHISKQGANIVQNNTQILCDKFISQLQDSPKTRSPSNSPDLTPQQVPTLRRFTIDDQVLAEQEGLLSISPTTIPETESVYTQNVTPTKLFLQPRSPTLSVSSNQQSPWLPQPKCSIQRFVDRRSNGFGSFATGGFFNQNGFRNIEMDSRRNNTEQQFASPRTIYGQSIILGENGSVNQVEESTHTTWRI